MCVCVCLCVCVCVMDNKFGEKIEIYRIKFSIYYCN